MTEIRSYEVKECSLYDMYIDHVLVVHYGTEVNEGKLSGQVRLFAYQHGARLRHVTGTKDRQDSLVGEHEVKPNENTVFTDDLVGLYVLKDDSEVLLRNEEYEETITL